MPQIQLVLFNNYLSCIQNSLMIHASLSIISKPLQRVHLFHDSQICEIISNCVIVSQYIVSFLLSVCKVFRMWFCLQSLFYSALSVLSVSCSQKNKQHQFSAAKFRLAIVWPFKEHKEAIDGWEHI